MENSKPNLKERLKELSKYIHGYFENPKAWGPRVAEGMVELDKRQDDHEVKITNLEKRVQEIQSKSSSDILKEVTAEINKAYGKIGLNAFMEYAKTDKGKEEIMGIMEANQDVIKLELQKVIEGKKGILSKFRRFVKFAIFTGTGIGLLVSSGVVATGVFYVMNRTTPGNVVKSLATSKQTITAYSEKIDNFEKKYSDEYFNTQKKSMDNAFANQQKNLEGQLKSYSDQVVGLKDSYEKQISDFKNSVDSYKKSNEELKASNDLYKKSLDEMQKTNDSNASKLKELENKVASNEKSYNSRIKKLEKAK